MMVGVPIALEVITGDSLSLEHRRSRPGLEGAGNRGLRRTPRPSTCPLPGRLDANGPITWGDGLGTPEEAPQPIEPFVDRALADSFLRDLDLVPPGGKAALPPQIRAQGTPAGTAGRHRDILRHGELLLKGIDSIATPLMQYISLQEFAF
jgi:hypothetical protein